MDREVDNIPMNKHPYRVQVVGANGEQITSFGGGGGGDVTISGEVEVKNDAGNPVPMSADSLPLPAGASTAANQATGNSSLGTIATNIGTTGANAKRIQGNSSSGAADEGDPQKTGRVYNSTQPTVTNGQRVDDQADTRGNSKVTIMTVDSATPVAAAATNVDGVATVSTTNRFQVSSLQYGYNSSTFDRWYSNWATSVLASAARTATTNSADQTNYNGRGVVVFLNVTANPGGAETLSMKVQVKDPVSGNYVDAHDAGVLFTAANGTKALTVYPGILAADSVSGDVGKSGALPRTWRVVVTHSSTGSWTYSVGSSVIV